jgi:regulation of enolase protein 1 (concanavalin A-like superfamily)
VDDVEIAGFPSPLEWDPAPVAWSVVVSVVTRGVSDDCNSFEVDGNVVGLRVARLGQAFAFHASIDTETWRLVRYFALEPGAEPRIGFLAQSPRGEGCSVRFEEISFTPGRLADIRSGA